MATKARGPLRRFEAVVSVIFFQNVLPCILLYYMHHFSANFIINQEEPGSILSQKSTKKLIRLQVELH
jgi:hypothetical protein